MFELRPYQDLLITGARTEFGAGKRRTCIVAPCGAGKTVIMAWMSAQSKIRGSRVMFVVHRQELIEQSSETFQGMGITHGIIAAGYSMVRGEAIQIASIQTVSRRLHLIDAPDVIILDEAHHATAGTWRKLLAAFPAAFVVGLTATPARLAGQGLGDVFESLIIGPTVKELIEWGNLAPYRYYAPPVKANLDDIKVRYGEFDRAGAALAMDKSEIIGDIILQYQRLAAGMQAVCYCVSRAHSEHTAEMFRQAGVPAVHIDGETADIVRTSTIADFKAGKIKVLCNVDLISEGFDVPAMEAVILARPTQSLTLYIQQAMRAMRFDKKKPDKVAVIIDHVGNVYRHGLPDDDREWSLEGRKKKKAGVSREFVLKQCPKCYAAHRPAPICPNCSHIYQVAEKAEPEQKAGGLAEIIELEKRQKKQKIGRARDVVTLQQIALEYGYRPGWVQKMCDVKNIPFTAGSP